MKIVVACIAVLLMAGCGTTPAELRADGKHFTTQTNLPAGMAARCLLNDFEARESYIRGRVTPLDNGAFEMLIWHDSWSRVLVEFRPVPGKGGALTSIDAWFAYSILDVGVDGGQVILAKLKGCA